MTDYYVAASGSDTNTGTFTAPWQTLARVNDAPLGRHDRVLFRRGDTFYGKLRPPTGLDASQPGWLRYGAYGENAQAPILSGWKVLNTAAGWVQHDADTWKVDIDPANVDVTYTGNSATSQNTADVGLLLVDGVIKPWKRSALNALSNQWDYHSDGTTLYVRSTAKPTTLAADIRASIDLDGVQARSCVEVADLTIEGYGSVGVYVARGAVPANRVRILRNTIRHIGGAYLDNYVTSYGPTRYGNAVVVWDKTTNFLGEYNRCHDVLDSAFTIQGGAAGVTGGFTNILWRRNLAYRCSQAEEFFFVGTSPGFVNCRSELNTYLYMGYGFGRDTRQASGYADRPYTIQTGYATYTWGDNFDHQADLTLRRNIYWDISGSLSVIGYSQNYANGTPPGLVSDRNVLALRPSAILQYRNQQSAPGISYPVTSFSSWAATVGREQHSVLTVLPASNDTDISNSDVSAAMQAVNAAARIGQIMSIQSPWRSL